MERVLLLLRGEETHSAQPGARPRRRPCRRSASRRRGSGPISAGATAWFPRKEKGGGGRVVSLLIPLGGRKACAAAAAAAALPVAAGSPSCFYSLRRGQWETACAMYARVACDDDAALSLSLSGRDGKMRTLARVRLEVAYVSIERRGSRSTTGGQLCMRRGVQSKTKRAGRGRGRESDSSIKQ